MRLNNKGYMLVEIIVCTAIAMGIAYYLIDMTTKFKEKNDDLFVEQKLINDKTLMTKQVMSDLSMYTVNKIANCSTASIMCIDITYKMLNGATLVDKVKRLSIDKTNYTFQYGFYNAGAYVIDNTYYKKIISNKLTLGTVILKNDCYGDMANTGSNEFKTCVASGASLPVVPVDNAIIQISFPATSKYFNRDYGLNIIISYNVKGVTITP